MNLSMSSALESLRTLVTTITSPKGVAITKGVISTSHIVKVEWGTSGTDLPTVSPSTVYLPVRAAKYMARKELPAPSSPGTNPYILRPRWPSSSSRAAVTTSRLESRGRDSNRRLISSLTPPPTPYGQAVTASSGISEGSTRLKLRPFSLASSSRPIALFTEPPPPVPYTAAPCMKSTSSCSDRVFIVTSIHIDRAWFLRIGFTGRSRRSP